MATASSGLTDLPGSLPKICLTVSMTFGMRDMPPTSTTSSMSEVLTDASLMAFSHGKIVRCTSGSTRVSNLARVSLLLMCLGPVASAVM
ncbi:hypothetical protein BC937DRAFT_89540 [Endogone sp. FLAS-F59071]|nr:hypothetical protein BC937DRAFT_89540 [Endogone sp. FLAS-F59071]|eukprot:RUS17749.1 hypothetical protein BC937DRAFT_89540 [Endogone sp. FLAS-F59071]